MKRIFAPTIGPCQWRTFLADPKKHWKRGRSAFEMAVSWEGAQSGKLPSGMPHEVLAVLETEESLRGAVMLLGIPEHQVPLDSANAPSCTDLWVLLRSDHGLISLGAV